MTTFFTRTIVALGAIGVVASVALSSGQTATSSAHLTKNEVKELVENAKTPADHMKLSKHYVVFATRYEEDAVEHAAMAAMYRKKPTTSESKRPGSVDTAAHCDRIAEAAKSAAKEARNLAMAHEHMAAAS